MYPMPVIWELLQPKKLCDIFTWPGIMNDIKNYVKSCNICQRHAPKFLRLPIQQANIITKPRDIDIVGKKQLDNHHRNKNTRTRFRKFSKGGKVKDFNTISHAQSDFTLKSSVNKMKWSNESQQSIDSLKNILRMFCHRCCAKHLC